MGRFGPFVQIGTKDDVEKPQLRRAAPGAEDGRPSRSTTRSSSSSCRASSATTAEGEPVSASVGRFGPYVQYGKKYVSLKQDDPYTITLERALEVIAEKKIADANRLILDFPDAGIQVLNGRYGPYITDKERNARMPKGRDPKSLTLEECRELLAAAPPRRKGGFRGRKAAPKEAAPVPAPAAPKEDAAAPVTTRAPAAPKKPRARRAAAGSKKPPAGSG